MRVCVYVCMRVCKYVLLNSIKNQVEMACLVVDLI